VKLTERSVVGQGKSFIDDGTLHCILAIAVQNIRVLATQKFVWLITDSYACTQQNDCVIDDWT